MADSDNAFEFSFLSCHPSPSAMCAADDVFHRGMILPLGAAPQRKGTGRSGTRRHPEDFAEGSPRHQELWGGRSGKGEYHRLRSASGHSDAKARPNPRRRCHVCVLGSAIVPPKMDMDDIRIRQRRLAPAGDSGVSGCGVNRGAWKLLRSLSCKGVESAAVATTPLGFVSHLGISGKTNAGG
ncbi:hypothetical protein BHE74_00050075 [Ensete ventricosum]|nr:hypothetical protein BHE74_00050075 [Ensete ventricosum]